MDHNRRPFREVLIVCECGGRVEPSGGDRAVCLLCRRAIPGLRVVVLDPKREYMREARS